MPGETISCHFVLTNVLIDDITTVMNSYWIDSEIELLSVMHNAEELSPEFLFLKSQIVRLSNKRDLKSKRDIHR